MASLLSDPAEPAAGPSAPGTPSVLSSGFGVCGESGAAEFAGSAAGTDDGDDVGAWDSPGLICAPAGSLVASPARVGAAL